MDVIPDAIPVTESIATDPAGVAFHIPPGVRSVKVTEDPTHIQAVPPIAAGTGLTVIVLKTGEDPLVYVMVVTPAANPATTPVAESIWAAAVPLYHVPPDVVSLSVIVLPTQTFEGPVIGPVAKLAKVTINAATVRLIFFISLDISRYLIQ